MALIFKTVLICLNLLHTIRSLGTHWKIPLRWMPQKFTDEKSTLVLVMAWCHQAPSHYLSQCWPRSLSSYGITRQQWVNYHNNLITLKCTWSDFFSPWNMYADTAVLFMIMIFLYGQYELELTHWCTNIFECIINFHILMQISPNFLPVMASQIWFINGLALMPNDYLSQWWPSLLIPAYMCHQASMS